MAEQERRVAAQSAAHAQGLADNLARQGYQVESRANDRWILRKRRRRGDQLVTIVIQQPSMLQPTTPPPPPPSGTGGMWPPPG